MAVHAASDGWALCSGVNRRRLRRARQQFAARAGRVQRYVRLSRADAATLLETLVAIEEK